MEEPKKFSFGFSKIVKKTVLVAPKPLETVDYIKCVEDNSVKLVNEEVVAPKPLPVIPMPQSSSVRDRILEAIEARKALKNGDARKNNSDLDSVEKEKEPESKVEPKVLTLDEMAAKELLEQTTTETEEKKEHVIAAPTDSSQAKLKESTLDDYEDMPIGDFGLAMLRGMGWDPKKGIGLNEKLITPVAPQVRPKGMGLGADRALAAQQGNKKSDDLVMKKGSMVKVITGPHNQLYGKVEGFEELPGRIMVRLALSNSVVSMSEFMVQLVELNEYNKNAKVMNLDQYNEALKPETESKRNFGVEKTFKKPERRSRSPEEKYSGRIKSERRSRSPVDKYSDRKKSERRSRSPVDKYSDRKKFKYSDKKREKSRKKYSSESESSDDEYRKSSSRHKSKKSKYSSDDDSDSSDERVRRDKNRDKKHSKSKKSGYRSDSGSDSHRRKSKKKHKKSRK